MVHLGYTVFFGSIGLIFTRLKCLLIAGVVCVVLFAIGGLLGGVFNFVFDSKPVRAFVDFDERLHRNGSFTGSLIYTLWTLVGVVSLFALVIGVLVAFVSFW